MVNIDYPYYDPEKGPVIVVFDFYLRYKTDVLLRFADKRAAKIMMASAQCSNCSFDMKSKACERTAFVICACIPYG